MGVSDVSYLVRGRTREQCQQALDRLCLLLGAEPTTGLKAGLWRAVDRAGRTNAEGPAGGEGLAVER